MLAVPRESTADIISGLNILKPVQVLAGKNPHAVAPGCPDGLPLNIGPIKPNNGRLDPALNRLLYANQGDYSERTFVSYLPYDPADPPPLRLDSSASLTREALFGVYTSVDARSPLSHRVKDLLPRCLATAALIQSCMIGVIAWRQKHQADGVLELSCLLHHRLRGVYRVMGSALAALLPHVQCCNLAHATIYVPYDPKQPSAPYVTRLFSKLGFSQINNARWGGRAMQLVYSDWQQQQGTLKVDYALQAAWSIYCEMRKMGVIFAPGSYVQGYPVESLEGLPTPPSQHQPACPKPSM